MVDLQASAGDPRCNDKIVVAMLAALGDRAAALQAAANLVQARGLFDAEVLFEPNMTAARGEPGYEQLVRKYGLVGYWRASPSPPDVCRDTAKPRFCSIA